MLAIEAPHGTSKPDQLSSGHGPVHLNHVVSSTKAKCHCTVHVDRSDDGAFLFEAFPLLLMRRHTVVLCENCHLTTGIQDCPRVSQACSRQQPVVLQKKQWHTSWYPRGSKRCLASNGFDVPGQLTAAWSAPRVKEPGICMQHIPDCKRKQDWIHQAIDLKSPAVACACIKVHARHLNVAISNSLEAAWKQMLR